MRARAHRMAKAHHARSRPEATGLPWNSRLRQCHRRAACDWRSVCVRRRSLGWVGQARHRRLCRFYTARTADGHGSIKSSRWTPSSGLTTTASSIRALRFGCAQGVGYMPSVRTQALGNSPRRMTALTGCSCGAATMKGGALLARRRRRATHRQDERPDACTIIRNASGKGCARSELSAKCTLGSRSWLTVGYCSRTL